MRQFGECIARASRVRVAMSGVCFSKTMVPSRAEKQVSRMDFEHANLLNYRYACSGLCSAQNRSISRNKRPDTLALDIKGIGSPNVQKQLPSFPFGCYTNPVSDM
jgi:hypothetical protein